MSEQSQKVGQGDRQGKPTCPQPGRGGSVLWFLWMVGLWVVFFVFLRSGRLDEVASTIKDLPLPLELLVWLLFFPWVLGTAVWTSDWSETTRMLLVVLFALGWTIVSIPRRRSTPPK
jgi:4-amino-4-deoxy-L-arabinose transferase-like glycosyltransferase